MKRITFILLFFAAFTVAAFAQRPANGTRPANVDSKEVMQRRAERVAKKMDLEDGKKEWFVALYAEYQDTLRATRQAYRPQGSRAGNKQKSERKQQNLSTEAAQKELDQIFQLEERLLALKRAYLARFSEQLTPQQMLHIFRANQVPGGVQSRNGRPAGMRPGMQPRGMHQGMPAGGDFDE